MATVAQYGGADSVDYVRIGGRNIGINYFLKSSFRSVEHLSIGRKLKRLRVMAQNCIDLFAILYSTLHFIERLPVHSAAVPIVARPINRFRDVLVEKLDHVEEIVLRVLRALDVYWPKALFSHRKENFKLNLSNLSIYVPGIDTFVPEGLREIPVFAKLIEDSCE
jgi:hypothetical protein